MEVAICPAAGHDFEKTITNYARLPKKGIKTWQLYKTNPVNETVNRRTFHGKQRRQIKLCTRKQHTRTYMTSK